MIEVVEIAINLDNISNEMCVPDKTENVTIKLFNMTAIIIESKSSLKLVSCDCKCRFKCEASNLNQKFTTINVTVNVKIHSNSMFVKKTASGIIVNMFVNVMKYVKLMNF